MSLWDKSKAIWEDKIVSSLSMLWEFIKSHKKTTGISFAAIILLTFASYFTYQYYAVEQATTSHVEHTKVLYHVELNGKEIGLVSDPSVVSDWMTQLLEEKREQYPDMTLSIDDKVSFQRDRLVKGEAEDQEVLDILRDQVKVTTEAVHLVVNGEDLGYVKDKKEIDKILQEMKEMYTKEQQQEDKKKTVKAAGFGGAELKEREVLEVDIADQIEMKTKEISPDQLVSMDHLKKRMVEGDIEQRMHVVQKGDCLSCIAYQYDMSTKKLLELNPGITEETILQIGQELVTTALEPKIHIKTVEKLVMEEPIDYKTEYRKDSSLYLGENRVKQSGVEGVKKVVYHVVKKNGKQMEREVMEEEVIQEPTTRIVLKGTKVVPNRGTGRFMWPTHGGWVTSGYGWRWGEFHDALDISGVSNRGIMASDAGVVEYAGWRGGYGNCIIINHFNGYKTLYGHLSSIKVSVGQKVGKGQEIGIMGTTGRSTGVHLHFEIIKNGSKINPLPFFR